MDSTFGLVGNGYVLLAADATAARSILVFKHDEDKIRELDSNKMMATSGVSADNLNFGEYIQKNMKLYELNNDVKLSTKAAANYIRGELAQALRRGPYQTNILLGGIDEENSVSLYTMDYLASMAKVSFGAQGYAANFVLSILDREWKPDMTAEEGLDVIRKCIHELHTRFLISQPKFVIKVIDHQGIRVVSL
jgi:20S proteasome alpha/beta subunit